jgi:hypothetical protein
MNTMIYTGLDHRSIIPYVQCESMVILLSFVSSSVELVAEKLQVMVLAFVLCPPFFM